MNTTTLSAATAALGAAAVVAASSASAATAVTQGAAIAAPGGSCSITVVDDTTAYTAAHCGAGAWSVGSPVRAADGTAIGTVAALPAGGVDVVKIDLAEDVQVVGDWSTRDVSDLAPTETVYTHGSSVPLGRPNTVSHPRAFDSEAVCGDSYSSQVALDAATTYAGDSGGAVYDAQQRVVGVISGVAPVTFDRTGGVVGCDARSMSTIMVPVEAIRAAEASTPAPAASAPAVKKAPKHAAEPAPTTAKEPAAPSTPAPTVKKAPKHAAEPAPTTAEAPAPTAKKAPKHAAEPAPASAGATVSEAGATTIVASPAEGVDFNTRVIVTTADGGFSYVKVTAVDGDGAVLGTSDLHLDGEIRAWLPVMADVPAGGHVEITTVGADGGAVATTATLGGVPVR